MKYPVLTLKTLHEIIINGILISIDDLVTGILHELSQKISHRTLIIDRSFVMVILSDDMILAIVLLSSPGTQSRGGSGNSEGVEQRHQAQFLMAHGCECAGIPLQPSCNRRGIQKVIGLGS
jgi:EAL domain-containing protein (putative c-di-GMP-specific phosphodiesterase class I)